MQVRKQQLELDMHGTTDWFQIGKGVHQGCILSPYLLKLYAEYIMRNTGLKIGLKFNIQKSKIMASGPITSWQIDRETVEKCLSLLFEAPKSLQMVIAAMKLKDAYSLKGKL